jgi:HK97 family phage major capsid protein
MNDAIVSRQRELAAIKKDMETLHKDSGNNKLSSDQEITWGQLLEKKNAVEAALQREVEIHQADKTLTALSGSEKEQHEEAERQESLANPKLFASLGDQMQAIHRAISSHGREVDDRLLKINAAASGAATSPQEDGGYFIQKQFMQDIWQNPVSVGQLAARCSKYTIGNGFNGIKIPMLRDTNRTDGNRFGGVAVYRAGEATSVDFTKIKFDISEMYANKMQGYFALTHEVMRDASAVESLTKMAIGQEFAVVLDEEIYDGDGGQGRCKGFMNSGAKISVSKETNQAAATLVPQNIVKMYARMNPRFLSNAVWLANNDIMPQLALMTLPIGTAGVPVFLPPNGLASAPGGMLYGRPIVFVETAETLGTEGDLVLADLSQYALVQKEGMRVAQSEHVLFASDQVVFRFTMEVGGQSKYNEPITPKKGTSNTLSPYVTLATRS